MILLLVLVAIAVDESQNQKSVEHDIGADLKEMATNRQLRRRRPGVEESGTSKNKNEELQNATKLRSEAFLMDLGSDHIPPEREILNALVETYSYLFDNAMIQDSFIADQYVLGGSQYVTVCVTVMENDPKAINLYNRRRPPPVPKLRRRRRPFTPLTPTELATYVSSSSIKSSVMISAMNAYLEESGYKVNLIAEMSASACGGTDMIPVPSPPKMSPSSKPSVTPESVFITPTTSPFRSFSNMPTDTPSTNPSLSGAPTSSPTSEPSFSLSPSVGLGPSDWPQYGFTISAKQYGRISLSEDGQTAAAAFRECTQLTACARVFQYKTILINENNVTDWHQKGKDIFAATSGAVIGSVALAGNGESLGLGMTSTHDTEGTRYFSIQMLSFHSTEWHPFGEPLDESLPYDDDYSIRVSLSKDADILSCGVATQASGGTSLFQVYKRGLDDSWQRFGNALTLNVWAIAEVSGDGKTVALLSSTSSHVYHLNSAGDWEERMDGLPSAHYYRMSFNENGTVMATRLLVDHARNFVEVFSLQNEKWELSQRIVSNSVYEERFGYDIELSTDGTTVAIATFTSQPTLSTCAQAFRISNTSSKWRPMGRPPCADNPNWHDGFGTFLALSGDGHSLAVGDYGRNGEDSGHIHTYIYDPEDDAGE